MQAVPYPESHVLGYQQRLLGDGFVVDVVGYVDETCQLLVYAVVGCPHPVLVVVRAVHLYQCAVLGRDGVEVSVAVVGVILLIVVEVLPGALHLAQFRLGGEVAGFAVAAERFVVDEGTFLTGAQLVHYQADVFLQLCLLRGIGAGGEGHGHCAHVMSAAVALQLRGGRVPSVGFGVAVGGQSVGVTVVIQLLLHVQRQQLVDVHIAVVRQTIFSVDAHLVEGQRFCQWSGGGGGVVAAYDLHLCRDGEAQCGGVVAGDVAAHLIPGAYGVLCSIGLGLLRGGSGIGPAYLAVLLGSVGVGHPQLVGQARCRAHGSLHLHSLRRTYGLVFLRTDGQC